MVSYEPQLIQQFADKLYSQASRVMLAYAGAGALGGFGLGSIHNAMTGFVCLALGGLVGLSLGSSRAFVLKLQAQQALCQLQTEVNTRQVGRVGVGQVG